MAKAATKKITSKKPDAKQSATTEPVDEGRLLKLPKYKSFKLEKKITIKNERTIVPSGFQLLKGALRIILKNWKPFLGILLLYGVFELVLVQGFGSSAQVNAIKNSFNGVFTGGIGHLAAGVGSFIYILGVSGTSATATAGSYQLVLMLIFSLAIIWTFRQVFNGEKVRVRDGFYQGMYPLVQFVFIVITITLEFLPIAIVSNFFSAAAAGGLVGSLLENAVWYGGLFLFGLLSLYMISSSIFALYIVCLPNMTPVLALQSARDLVAFRRWTIMRRVFFLPIALLVMGGVLMIPIIAWVPAASAAVLYVLLILVMPIFHGYLYSLYRSLL